MNKRLVVGAVVLLLTCFVAAEAFGQAAIRFELSSNVRGADVLLDGRAIGKTPFSGKVTAGRHTVQVAAEGYKTEERSIVFRSDVVLTINLEKIGGPDPEPRAFQLRIDSNVRGADIFVDGKEMGKTPETVTLRPGKYTVKVTAPGYVDFVTDIRLTDDTRVNADMQRAQQFFTLSINANVRGAQVFIGNKAMGNVPFRTKLEDGRYIVKVTAPGYEEFVTEVRLKDDTKIDADLQKTLRSYTLGISANARGAQVFIDDKLAGVAPLRTKLVQGQHELRITAPGFEDYAENFELDRDRMINVNLERMRRFYTLSVQANSPQAKVWINDQEQEGFAPLTVKLEEGTYKVRVLSRWARPYLTTVTLNRDTRVQADLSPAKAKIKVVIPEEIVKRDLGWRGNRITVLVDGRPQRGFEFEIDRGRHTVRVEAGSWFVEQQLSVRDGRLYTLTPVFTMEVEEEQD